MLLWNEGGRWELAAFNICLLNTRKATESLAHPLFSSATFRGGHLGKWLRLRGHAEGVRRTRAQQIGLQTKNELHVDNIGFLGRDGVPGFEFGVHVPHLES